MSPRERAKHREQRHKNFDWAAYSEAVAAAIFGDCNDGLSRPPEDVRFGTKGSVSINYTTGEWYDHEHKRGGGIKELIRVYEGIEDRDEAISYAKKCQSGGTGNGRADKSARKPRPNGGAGNKSQQRELEATYAYRDAAGQPAFEVCRIVFKQDDGSYVLNADGKRTKAFLQRRLFDGGWLWNVSGGEFMRPGPDQDWVSFDANKFDRYSAATRQQRTFAPAPVLPYRLPELLQALAAGQTICVAEGEKKVNRIRELGFPATCNAGGTRNWRPEHTAFLRGADVVLLPDNDDVGREFVMSIATDLCPIAERVRVLVLADLPPKGDVVDWQGSAEEFAKLVAAAPEYVVDQNAEPQPLMRSLPPPEPLPIDALGPDLAAAANAIHDIVQAPIEICAGAVLASASLAISAHIDVKLPTGEPKPVSTYFWCIAVSGERKTSVDNRACAAQSQREQQLRTGLAAEQERHRVRHAMWQAQSKALTKQFDKSGEAGSEAHQLELEKLGPEPEPPLETLLTSSDFTFEGLVHCLNVGQPIYGIIGSEGGQFVGGHGMTDDAKLRTISNLCAVWDGKPIKRVRAKEIIVLYNRRVGMHLMLQPEVAAIALGDSLLHAQGFLARVLTCFPESMIGTRLHKEPPPEAVQSVQDYNKRVLAILGTPYPLVEDSRNELDPRELPFSKEAEKLFWEFADEVEEAQNAGGEYETIKAFAGKLPEHAARLAAVIAGYRDLHATELGREDLLCGIRLASFYAAEAKRLIASAFTDPKLLQAEKLLDWLRQDWNSDIVTAREIYTYGPNTIRDRNTALALATILVDHGWLKPIKKRRRDMSEWEIVGKE